MNIVERYAEDPTTAGTTGLRTRRALVVDDNDDFLRTIVQSLLSIGWDSIAVSDPQRALDVCSDGGEIDVVLADVVMPGLDGIEMATRIKAVRPGLPVVLMTGHAETVDKAIAAGAIPLLKPFSILALERILNDTRDDGAEDA
jgi:CheY-like chemotaxis protein